MRKVLTPDELVILVNKIMDCTGSDSELTLLLAELEQNVPHPYVSDLIFYPLYEDVTPEQIVAQALAWQPIIL